MYLYKVLIARKYLSYWNPLFSAEMQPVYYDRRRRGGGVRFLERANFIKCNFLMGKILNFTRRTKFTSSGKIFLMRGARGRGQRHYIGAKLPCPPCLATLLLQCCCLRTVLTSRIFLRLRKSMNQVEQFFAKLLEFFIVVIL